MSLVVACAKCGEGITVDDSTIKESQTSGVPLSVTHEVCPRDAVDLPQYEIVVTVHRIVPGAEDGKTLLTSVGKVVEAPTFRAAIPSLNKAITEQWEKAISLAEIVEA